VQRSQRRQSERTRMVVRQYLNGSFNTAYGEGVCLWCSRRTFPLTNNRNKSNLAFHFSILETRTFQQFPRYIIPLWTICQWYCGSQMYWTLCGKDCQRLATSRLFRTPIDLTATISLKYCWKWYDIAGKLLKCTSFQNRKMKCEVWFVAIVG
jgi:hypothetical protein